MLLRINASHALIMNISKADFDRAAGQVSLTPSQAQELWSLLQTGSTPGSGAEGTRRFDVFPSRLLLSAR